MGAGLDGYRWNGGTAHVVASPIGSAPWVGTASGACCSGVSGAGKMADPSFLPGRMIDLSSRPVR